MSLSIIVCIKQVPRPDPFSQLSFDPVRKTILREGIPAVINPQDKHALEEGMRIRERFSGKVTAISMGPPQVREALEEALAMGVDDAVLLCDPAFAGADTLATAYTLARGIQGLGQFDLILCGNETTDSATAQVGPQLAQFLDIPHVTHARKIAFTRDSLLVERTLEHGYMKVSLSLPALVAVLEEINQPRLSTVLGIMEAMKKQIKVWGLLELKVKPDAVGVNGSPTRVVEVFEHYRKRGGEILQGLPQEVTKKAVDRLRELGAV